MNIKYFLTNGYDFYAGEEVSETEYIGLPICQPEMELNNIGSISVSTNAITIGAPIMRVFSAPINL